MNEFSGLFVLSALFSSLAEYFRSYQLQNNHLGPHTSSLRICERCAGEMPSLERRIYRPLNLPKSHKTFDLFLLHMRIRTQVCLFWKNSIKTFDYNLLLIFCHNLWWSGRPCVHADLSSAKIIRYRPTNQPNVHKLIYWLDYLIRMLQLQLYVPYGLRNGDRCQKYSG